MSLETRLRFPTWHLLHAACQTNFWVSAEFKLVLVVTARLARADTSLDLAVRRTRCYDGLQTCLISSQKEREALKVLGKWNLCQLWEMVSCDKQPFRTLWWGWFFFCNCFQNQDTKLSQLLKENATNLRLHSCNWWIHDWQNRSSSNQTSSSLFHTYSDFSETFLEMFTTKIQR